MEAHGAVKAVVIHSTMIRFVAVHIQPNSVILHVTAGKIKKDRVKTSAFFPMDSNKYFLSYNA
jgi:hypothetical protein